MISTFSIEDYLDDMKIAIEELDRDILHSVKKIWIDDYQDIKNDNRIFIIGNGGSCAIAEHISTDLNKRCRVKAHTLSNNSLLTALTNDYSQEEAIAQWLKINSLNQNDYLVAISSSGKSPNIITAINYASKIGCKTFSIFGMDGEPIAKSQKDIFIKINSYNYGVVELTSEIVLHSIVEEMVLD